MTFTEQEIAEELKEFWLDPYTTDNQYVEMECFVNNLLHKRNPKYFILRNLAKRQLEQKQQLKEKEVS
jgi:hypothetical protein